MWGDLQFPCFISWGSRVADIQLDLSRVSREIHSIVGRRKELMLFVGAVFAGMGVYLENVTSGKLPTALKELSSSGLTTYSLALLLVATIVSMRIAKLHYGMVINGGLYHLIAASVKGREVDLKRLGRFNWFGVSFQFFLVTAMLASMAASLVAASTGANLRGSMVVGGVIGLGLAMFFAGGHWRASHFVQRVVGNHSVEKGSREELEDHIAMSMEDTNHDMIAIVSFLGLIFFSVLSSSTGLGDHAAVAAAHGDALRRHGPMILSGYLVAVCLAGLVAYLRLAVNIPRFSLELDPTDRPFRLKLSDTFLGYCLAALLFVGALRLWVSSLTLPEWERLEIPPGVMEVAAFAVCVFAYVLVMATLRRALGKAK